MSGRRLSACGVAMAALLAGAAGAAAQDRPPLFPSKDVTVNYRILGREGGQAVTISQAAGAGMMRVDNPQMGGFALMDTASGRATFVMTQMRTYMEMPPGQLPIHAGSADKDAKFTRKGTETIAGVACTVWDMTSSQGEATTCVSADGVMLRVRTRSGDGMEATKVTFAALPKDSFAVPAGFQKMDMPGMGAMPGPGGGQRGR